MNPFDFVNSINSGKNIMVDEQSESAYVPFVVNRALSYFADTISAAQNMNMNHHLDNKWQYSYLINTVRPRKRWSKWAKKHEDSDLEAIKTYYGYNDRNASIALELLTKHQIDEIKNKNNKGGIK